MNRAFRPARFLATALCFLLPFLLVSCPGKTVAFSGVQLATGTTVTQPQMFGPPKSQHLDAEPLAAAALLCAVAGIFAGLAKGVPGRGASALFAIVGGVCLIALQVSTRVSHPYTGASSAGESATWRRAGRSRQDPDFRSPRSRTSDRSPISGQLRRLLYWTKAESRVNAGAPAGARPECAISTADSVQFGAAANTLAPNCGQTTVLKAAGDVGVLVDPAGKENAKGKKNGAETKRRQREAAARQMDMELNPDHK